LRLEELAGHDRDRRIGFGVLLLCRDQFAPAGEQHALVDEADAQLARIVLAFWAAIGDRNW
jgi:hypothetical protein